MATSTKPKSYLATTESDWEDYYKSLATTEEGVYDWSKFLTGEQAATYASKLAGLSSEYAQGVAQQQAATAYDISSAYENYKKSQLQLMQNQRLGEGFKEAVGSELKTAYSSAYEQFKAQEQQNISKLYGSTSSALESLTEKYKKTATETLETNAAKLQQAVNSIYEFANTQEGWDFSDLNKITTSIGEGGYGFYQRGGVGAAYEPTEYVKDFYKNILNSAQYSDAYYTYLAQEHPEIADWVKQNPGIFKEALGLEATDVGLYNPEERTTTVNVSAAKELSKNPEIFARYNTSVSDETLNKLKNKPYYVTRAKDYSEKSATNLLKTIQEGKSFWAGNSQFKFAGTTASWRNNNDKAYQEYANKLRINIDDIKQASNGEIFYNDDKYYIFLYNGDTIALQEISPIGASETKKGGSHFGRYR